MTARLITDRDTGRLVAVSSGPIPVLDQTLDAGSEEKAFAYMLGRRMAEVHAHPAPQRRMTYSERVALDRYLGWETVTEASVRADTESFLDARAHAREREIGKIVARRPELKSALLGRRALAVTPVVTCPTCGAPDSPASQFCTSCGTALSPTEVFAGEQAGDTAQCDQCGRFNPTGSSFCAACGSPLVPVAPIVQASSAPRRAVRSGARLVCSRTFKFLNRYTQKWEWSHAGKSYCTSDAEAYKADPSAWVAS